MYYPLPYMVLVMQFYTKIALKWNRKIHTLVAASKSER